MNIEVMFEKPHTYWNVLLVYQKFFNWFKEKYTEHNVVYRNSDPEKRGNPSGPHSPHVMVIRNLDNQKYIIVSYWDRAIELTWPGCHWDVENRVDLVTSSGVHFPMEFTPFSYICHSNDFEKVAEVNKIPFEQKESKPLLFRGYLYNERKIFQTMYPDLVTEERKGTVDYFQELNERKICLSFNGAAEICHRDMEILSAGSVLFRPELSQVFYNKLIPNYHYLSVPKERDPILQFKLLLDKYEEVKNNDELLSEIANNGYEWYKKNGTTDSNVELLKSIINLEKLL
jgi:hypothetical protein